VAAIAWLAAIDELGIMRKVVANNPNAAEHPLKYDQPILALSASLRSCNLPTPRKSSIPPDWYIPWFERSLIILDISLSQHQEIQMAVKLNNKAVLKQLNIILELELAGVIRYTHYSFMVHGFGRIPIVSWLRGQAGESMVHAHEAGELITQLEGKPSLQVGELLGGVTHDTRKILEESLAHEQGAAKAYAKLLKLVQGKSVMLEEYASRMVSDETRHIGDVEKMLRTPTD
jgi:bacterioferritin